MSYKKSIIKDAIIEAKELEKTAIENAQDMVMEQFKPTFATFFSDLLKEEDEENMEDEEETSDEEDKEEVEEGTEHDIGKEKDAGRDDTDAATDKVNEEDENMDDEDEDGDSNLPSDEDEEKNIDIPDELFDMEEDEEEAGEPELASDEDDEEFDFSIEDDEDEGEELKLPSDNDEVDEEFDFNDDEESDSEEAADEEKEEYEEGLYIRKEGEFKPITPAEYLQTRISELEEENEKLTSAVGALNGQLKETHLFNAKLAHLNKLYLSGAFTSKEKESIAKRLDGCDSINEVKNLYKTIVAEVKEKNPLDDFSNLIKEARLKKSTKSEKVFESPEMARMRRMAGIE